MLNPEDRKLVKGRCSYCNKEIEKREIHFKLHKDNFCSQKCQNEYKKTGTEYSCAYCGKKVYRCPSQLRQSKSGRVFCNRSCATKYNNTKYKSGENHPNYTDGIGSYRKRALDKYGKQCNKCGYNRNKYILEVHHKDRDRINNNLKNLEVLCPNCHHTEHFNAKDGMYWMLK